MNGRWDLSYIYKNCQDPAIAADMEKLTALIEALRQAVAADGDTVSRLEKMVDTFEEMSAVQYRLGAYCQLTLAVDAANNDAARILDRVMLLDNDAQLAVSDMIRAIGTAEGLEDAIAASEKLQKVAFALREAQESVKHIIPKELEPWVLEMSLSGGSAFSQLRDKLDANHTASYRGESLPLSAVRGLAYDPYASVRKDAYEAEIASYSKMEVPMSYCLNSIKQEARTLAKLKGYDSVLAMTLDESRMDKETLDAMWGAIREYLPHFRRYLKAKAKYLGHENGLPFYDLFAPVGESTKVYSIEEAQEKLQQVFGAFSPEMAAFMDHAFKADWIDLYPREGKAGGAFCESMPEYDRSVVMTNFQGSFSDISTLAHELGHAWHNRCLAGLPFLLLDTPMPLAETASIFNETVLSHQALKDCSPEEELTLIESGLMEATQTVVDIYSRFLFEQKVIDTRADHAMSVDELKAAMLEAQEQSYGDGLDADIRHPYMWACKSHYYSSGLNFYNFPYAFGLLFGKGVFARYLEQGDSFIPEYCKLLRMCGSDTVANVAASVGIDVHDINFWRSSLEVIRQDIDRFCQLCEK
ncbi:MAG: M3 family oligoendopeptidase [Clostridia bacterium]|nr:M3 family oligoendopeptidase [Clostridia bacterium]